MRIVSKLVLWVLGVGLAVSCAPSAHSPSQLRTPGNVDDLLKNIWSAAQSGLILREDFYTEDNLKRAFGGAHTSFSQRCADNTSARITDFPSWFPRYGQQPINSGEVDLRRVVMVDKRVGAYVHASWSSGMNTPHFDDIEKLFGKGWTECPLTEFTYSPHRIVAAPIHPKGDSCIVYADPAGTSGARMVFLFWSNATLFLLTAEAGRKIDRGAVKPCSG